MNKSKIIIHPGVYIKEELEEREWSQRDLAYILGCSEQAITVIINGKRSITPEMAKALAIAFDVSSELFANLQQTYDLAKAKDPNNGIATRKLIQSSYPAREMVKRGWLIETQDVDLLMAQMASFFGVSSLEEVPHLRHAARKTYYDRIPSEQLAWLFRVKNLAKKMKVSEYSKEALSDLVSKMKKMLISPENIQKIPKLLSKVGVRFLLVESLPSSKIDGVCFWLDENSPVIGMSMRYDRIDNFWFNLRHEIEHILRKDGLKEEVIDAEVDLENNYSKKIQKMENAANKAASEFLINSHEFNNFFKENRTNLKNIQAFATIVNVHPGIIVGKLQNEKLLPYSAFRNQLVPVRHFLISGMQMVDGWGSKIDL